MLLFHHLVTSLHPNDLQNRNVTEFILIQVAKSNCNYICSASICIVVLLRPCFYFIPLILSAYFTWIIHWLLQVNYRRAALGKWQWNGKMAGCMTHRAAVFILLSGKNCKDSFWRSCSQTVHLAWITHMNMKLNLFAKWLGPNQCILQVVVGLLSCVQGRGVICEKAWSFLPRVLDVQCRFRCRQMSQVRNQTWRATGRCLFWKCAVLWSFLAGVVTDITKCRCF